MNCEEFKLLSINQTAKILGIGVRALRSLISAGRIAVIYIGKREKISYRELNLFINSAQKLEIVYNDCETIRKDKSQFNPGLILEKLIKEKTNGIRVQTKG